MKTKHFLPFIIISFSFEKTALSQDSIPAPQTLWQKSIAANFSSAPILRTGADGSVLVMGEITSTGSSSQPTNILFRFSKEGRRQAFHNNFAPGLTLKDIYSCFHNGQWLVAGNSATDGAVISCYSEGLKRLWNRVFAGASAHALAAGTRGFTYAVLTSTNKEGEKTDTTTGRERSLFPFELVCINEKGKPAWRTTFYAEGFLRGVKILPIDSVLYLAVNTTILNGPDHHDLHVFQVNGQGELRWQRQLTGAGLLGDVSARSLVIGPGGQMHIAGISTDSLTYGELAGSFPFTYGEPYSFTLSFDKNGALRSLRQVTLARDRFQWPVIDLLWCRPDNHLLLYSDAETGVLLVSNDIFPEDKTKAVCRLPKPGYNDAQLFAAAGTKGCFYRLKHQDGTGRWELLKLKLPE